MTEEPFYKRLRDHSPKAANALAQAAVGLTLAMLSIDDDSTCYDYATALDNMLTALGVPDTGPVIDPPDNYVPSSTPLYLRIQDTRAQRPIQQFMLALNLNVLQIKDKQIQAEYNAAMLSFWSELGLPTVEAVRANPDAYPKVNPGLFPEPKPIDLLSSTIEVAELEEMFNLDTTQAS